MMRNKSQITTKDTQFLFDYTGIKQKTSITRVKT